MLDFNNMAYQGKLITFDGISGSGKSEAAKYAAEHLNVLLLRGDPFLFEFIKDNPRLMKNIFNRSVAGLSGFDYFVQHCFQSPEQYIELLANANPHIEERVHDKIVRLSKFRTPPQAVVYDYATSTSQQIVKKEDTVLVTADSDKRRKALKNREGFTSDFIPLILEQGQSQLIRPERAGFELQNGHRKIEELHESVREILEVMQSR